MAKLSISQGKVLVSMARKAIETYLTTGRVIDYPRETFLLEKRGVFTTLRLYPSGDLRGCIGYPYPILPLGKALIDSAIQAATSDPRFWPVSLEEMNHVTVEVTVLTIPQKLSCDPEDRPNRIVVGKHGLIVRSESSSGLLLPQVPSEVGWKTAEEFLDGTCVKAGLEPGCWKRRDVDVLVFEGQIFAESEPGGEVVENDSQEN